MREEKKFSKMKRFFKRRWVLPAIYIASAAIILTAILWYQNSKNVADSDQYDLDNVSLQSDYFVDDDSVPVTQSLESFMYPVTNVEEMEIQKQFYDADASDADQEAALLYYDNQYIPNKGIDIVTKDNSVFDVVASASGTVTRTSVDSTLGNVVEIDHGNGIVTVYQSLADIQVQENDMVEQGQVIAQSGRSLLNSEAENHVHFEIRKNDEAINPINLFGSPITSLLDEDENMDLEASEGKKEETLPEEEQKEAEEEVEEEEEEAPAEEKEKEEEAPAEEEKPGDEKEDKDS
ncbi:MULTISPECIES: M23 family metallopeptidase [Bacillaceae]|uniref:M23 family metallopeptidase n=1 Tax=Bacillaceae TaxID=186817 RepID=UPI002A17A8A6|nr:M23 family metallopeptidase [Cytobacillus sp. IB215316]MDX8361094.1 M23 family metallopeptidase [Cytobacillus sp. IB215316]